MANLVSSVTQIDSRSGTQIITLTHRVNKQKLILKLSNDDELASWLRKLSDLTTLDLISDNSENDKNKETEKVKLKTGQHQWILFELRQAKLLIYRFYMVFNKSVVHITVVQVAVSRVMVLELN